MIAETIIVFLAISILAVCINTLMPSPLKWFFQLPLLIFQGLWFYRFYIVGHEASHKKLFPQNIRANDFWGWLILLPILTPVNIYRKIHYFHHGFNRKDHHTSALDTFVVRGRPTTIKKIYYYTIWYISIFCGGFFLHSLVSVLLFLFIPVSITRKISPAFKGWSWKDQIWSIALFSVGILLHLTVYRIFGSTVYLYTLGFPMLSFAWILSLMVYIFHYDTTVGHEVRYNVRSVKKIPVLSWVLLNFNEHATHHQYPNIPWHELPSKRSALPEEYSVKNQSTWNIFKAIYNQLKGPSLIYEDNNSKS